MMKLTISKIFFATLSLLLLASCTPSYHFKVDAISGGEFKSGGSFFLTSGNPKLNDSDLRFKEAAKYVTHALEGKGFNKAKDLPSADMLVEVFFEVGEPREVMEITSSPETHWRPGFTYSIQVPIYNKQGLVVRYATRIVREPPRSYTYWEDRVHTGTVFEKVLKIQAYDNRTGSAANEPQQLWSVVVTNTDYSEDLRGYLPYMIAGALPYIGEDTINQIRVSVSVDDPTVGFVINPDLSQGIE